jgi:hypothetical protein
MGFLLCISSIALCHIAIQMFCVPNFHMPVYLLQHPFIVLPLILYAYYTFSWFFLSIGQCDKGLHVLFAMRHCICDWVTLGFAGWWNCQHVSSFEGKISWCTCGAKTMLKTVNDRWHPTHIWNGIQAYQRPGSSSSCWTKGHFYAPLCLRRLPYLWNVFFRPIEYTWELWQICLVAFNI